MHKLPDGIDGANSFARASIQIDEACFGRQPAGEYCGHKNVIQIDLAIRAVHPEARVGGPAFIRKRQLLLQ